MDFAMSHGLRAVNPYLYNFLQQSYFKNTYSQKLKKLLMTEGGDTVFSLGRKSSASIINSINFYLSLNGDSYD